MSRCGLIAAGFLLSATGAALLLWVRAVLLGSVVFGTGMLCMSACRWLERRDERREQVARQAWMDSICALADDPSLDGYGIPSLLDRAAYHDASVRAAVLAALESQPLGQRSLLAAARAVDPDAQWD